MNTLRGSVATRIQQDEELGTPVPVTDCWKVLLEYSSMKYVPKHFGELRAAELAKACQWAIAVIKHDLTFTVPPEDNE